jgi:hypothetical protein
LAHQREQAQKGGVVRAMSGPLGLDARVTTDFSKCGLDGPTGVEPGKDIERVVDRTGSMPHATEQFGGSEAAIGYRDDLLLW